MTNASTRFGLPFILPGQAQKEMFHNEALVRIDAALHPCVEGAPLDQPPAAPDQGQAWLVGSAPTGAWAGRQGSLATWTDGGWRFATPQIGMCVWDKQAGWHQRWTGAAWNGGDLDGSALRVDGLQVVGSRRPSISNPSGGTIIDLEGRAAVEAVIVALRSHGLIE